jgi:hypothetical protein
MNWTPALALLLALAASPALTAAECDSSGCPPTYRSVLKATPPTAPGVHPAPPGFFGDPDFEYKCAPGRARQFAGCWPSFPR